MNGDMGGGASGLQAAPTSPLQPPAPPTAAALRELQKRKRVASEDTDQLVDCYPYAFSPLLLFAPSAYFDRGYSNYHAVAQFFSGGNRSYKVKAVNTESGPNVEFQITESEG